MSHSNWKWLRDRKEKLNKWVLPIRQRKWPTWRLVRIWGNNRFAKSAYIWLVIVPLGAKLLAPLAGTYDIPMPSEESISVVIGLPFSWKLFFVAALLITFAQIIYQLRCPEIVRDYASFADYRAKHFGNSRLRKWASDLCNNLDHIHSSEVDGDIKSLFINEADNQSIRDKIRDQGTSHVLQFLLDDEHGFKITFPRLPIEAVRGDLFDKLVEWAARQNYRAILASFLMYMGGTAIFLVVLAQNIVFVCFVILAK